MNYLLKVRKLSGMKQCELSELSGIDVSTLSFYENGLRKPTVKNAKILGRILGFDWTKLFDEEDHDEGRKE